MTRGLPHKLTQSLSYLVKERVDYERHRYSGASAWNPKLDPSSVEYKPQVFAQGKRASNRSNGQERQKALGDEAWGALGEVVQMAEGRHGISLGRIVERRGYALLRA
ncbi:hypothetical protein PHLCEN_2v8668 [Hermanssonia centrifuga]|uniref:Uncharacterized protein n=1 Tax=Hermanssonia centrifuga TaxID=98765 RepID=A0A2R6NT01_9APHY|nr:hypothetical protein PHLCEN_2v8668 [Hermanssonia centrifuga]